MESWSFWVHYLGILLNLWLSVMLVWRTLDRSFLVMVSTANPCVPPVHWMYCFETILLEYNTILQCRWNTWPSWQLCFHRGTLLLFCQSSSTLVWGLITAASRSLSTCLSSTSTLVWDLITAAGRSLSTCFSSTISLHQQCGCEVSPRCPRSIFITVQCSTAQAN